MTRQARWTLAVVCAATSVLLLDVTVVNVALPAIRSDLDASFDDLQWVIDAYALTLAALLLTAGSLADRLGRRSVFSAGLVVFTLSSLACGLAWSPAVLDIARAAQGVGAAAMFATSLALLANEFSGKARGLALGIWGATSGGALAIGPIVGGALVDGPGWEWIFLINLPIGATLLALTVMRVPESRDPGAGPTDWAGMVLFGSALFLFVLGLIRGNAEGWSSAPIVLALGGGMLLLFAFVAVEWRSRSPMLDLSLFRIPPFSGVALVAFSQSVALYPLFLFVALYMQELLGHTPWETGLRLLPVTVGLFAVAPISGALTGRMPLRILLCGGLAMIGGSLLLMRGIDPGDEWTVLLPGFILGGIGIGTISPALAAAMVSVLPVERSGLSSGFNNTFRQIGIAAGVAGLGAIFEHRARAGGAEAFVEGLNAVFLVAALVALVSVPIAWGLLGAQRATETEAA